MEANPVEAVKNNVFGTKNIVDAAQKSGVERFVLISTDKAVEPSSVYGASKLLAEEIVLREGKSGRHFLVVRFGNVLGSRGSILPLFRRQILKGGPVTVTHPETRRYFMTIPEASSLVLKAGGVGRGRRGLPAGHGGERLHPGAGRADDPVLRLRAGTDIPIVYTGLRKGEKLLEKLYADTEVPEPTEHPKILKLRAQDPHQREDHLGARAAAADLLPRPRERPRVFRNRRALRAVLEEVIPGIGPAAGRAGVLRRGR